MSTPLKPRWNTPALAWRPLPRSIRGAVWSKTMRTSAITTAILCRSGILPPFRAWFRHARVLICVALALLTSARHAGAAAGQWQAGGRVGMAWLDGPRVGPSAEAFLRRGLGDAIDLDVQLLTSLHPFQSDANLLPDGSNARTGVPDDAPADVPWVLGVAPGLSYRWDVLRVIPFAGLGVGVYGSDGLSSRWNGLQFGAVARAGVEYLLNRDVVLSVQGSTHLALTESPIPSPYIQLTVGAGYVWGW